MKAVKKLFSILFAASLFMPIFAQEDSVKSVELPITFSITTDFAYYPKSAPIVSKTTHFAPLTGVYSGIEGRITGHAYYTIPTPLSDNPLMSGDNVTFDGYLEVTPVSIKPGLNISFTPIAFLVFSAGAEAGTGWNLAGIEGMAEWNPVAESHYASITPFTSWYYHFWAQGTFQFDTGAIIPGDWTHIVMMASYKAEYTGLSGRGSQDLWLWQTSGNQVNGWKYYSNAILAYQMPLMLKRAGVMAEFQGYYSDNAYANAAYDGNFMRIDISPLLQFQFGAKDSLAVLFNFARRRGYSSEYTDGWEETFLSTISGEWYFNRIALSWSHNF